MGLQIRPYLEDDIQSWVGIHNQNFPENPRSIEVMRHDDSLWNNQEHFRQRLVAEEAGHVVGTAVLEHMPWQFHPGKYRLSVEVAPSRQRQGIGSALYGAQVATARERGAVQVRGEAQESMTHVVDFLAHRDFEEVQRTWESRLDVARFEFSRFEGAEARALGQGITLTTLADEGLTENVLQGVYELDVACSADEPSLDPITSPPFEVWVKDGFEAPYSLPEAYFLAKDGDRYVGLSGLFKSLSMPDVLQQGFTAVARDYRGRGIALALKIRGVNFAQARGYREIRTHNNSRNRPMLRINEAMGFEKQPVWIEFARVP